MSTRKLIWLLALGTLAVFFYFLGDGPLSPKNPPDKAPESSQSSSLPTKEIASPKTSRSETLLARTPSSKPNLDDRLTRYSDGSIDLRDAIESSSQFHQSDNTLEDLEILSHLLSHYRLFFQKNPVGVENFEFTDALTGNNPKKVNFIAPSSPALSNTNELLDRWGSPFVFHPLSGTEMELRSLGPDKTLWTADDLLLNPY